MKKAINHYREKTPSAETTQAGDQLTERDKLFVNRIFADLIAAKPAWHASFKSDEDIHEGVRGYKRQLAIGLIENGVRDQQQINRGMRLARSDSSPFLPAVGRFVEWCKVGSKDIEPVPAISGRMVDKRRVLRDIKKLKKRIAS